jgi:prepilin-type N-terminal cleavage/methylation domain-containing protein
MMTPTVGRGGFTLMEMMAVMLVILTVLAMGVPAMFTAERKAYLSSSIQKLCMLHQRGRMQQLSIATQGYANQISLAISGTNAQLKKDGVVIETVAMDEDGFIESVTPTGNLWNYDKKTGFINLGSPLSVKVSALSGKATRIVKFYPNGLYEESMK